MAVSNSIDPRPARSGSSFSSRCRRPVAVVATVTLVILGLVGPALAESYVVKPGDSLSVIARDHGVTTEDLAAANAISNLHLIRVGQQLRIPGVVYEVRSGDSLSVIAARSGVSLAELIAVNGITNPNLIRVGQELKLPSGALSPAPLDPAAGYDRLPGRLLANPERLELIPSFERWSEHYGVSTDLLMAVAYRESGWQTSVVSPKGAVGVGQLMPLTSEWVADHLIGQDLDPTRADDNIRMSARFLDWLIGYMGSEDAAVAGYYQGPNSVRAIGLYDDTEDYLANIAQIRTLFTKNG